MYVFMETKGTNFVQSKRSKFHPTKKKHKSRMSRIIDSKWDKLKHSSSSSSSSSSSEEDDDDDEGEKEAGITRSALLENLSLCCCSSSSSSAIWTGLVLHHKDIFVSHVLSKLNEMDRCFFSEVNRESWGVLEYAGVNVSGLGYSIVELTSISTLEWAWNNIRWGEKYEDGRVKDQAWFCMGVAGTNKLEFLKWAREVKHCEWDEWTIKAAAAKGNREMLKYCFYNGCPCDKNASCKQAALGGHLDCVRFLFDKVKPSRDMEEEVAGQATGAGHVEILKYIVEERKISDVAKLACAGQAAWQGHLNCLQYLVEEAKVPLDNWRYIASARILKHHDCLNYLLEKGSPEPTDEEYDLFDEEQQQLRFRTAIARLAGFPGF